VELDSKISELINQIKKREEEYHKLMEMRSDATKELEDAKLTLRKYNKGFKDYDDLNMEIARLRNTYNSLDEEYRKKREQVELGLNLFNLLTEAGEYNLQGLKLMCRNIVNSATIGNRDFREIKLRIIEVLTRLTQNNLVALSTTDGDRLKIKFVRSEEYYENIQKFLEIEKRMEEVEKIEKMINNEGSKLVKAELESRGEDPTIRPYIREAVKEVIREIYEAEVQRISLEEFKKSGARALLTLSGFGDKTGTKEEWMGESIRVVYLNDSGKTDEDTIWPDKALKSLLEGKEVEGLYNYYDSCEALKAIIMYYLNKKHPVLPVLRKKEEIRIFKGVIILHPRQ
jgi:hypothetical protein